MLLCGLLALFPFIFPFLVGFDMFPLFMAENASLFPFIFPILCWICNVFLFHGREIVSGA